MTAAIDTPPAPSASPAPRAAAATGADEHIIELRDVHKYYTLGAKRLHVLKGISVKIPRGQYVAVMGSSGSGKSTLLNLLGLLDVVDSGDYMLAGENVARMKDDLLARHRNARIGFIFQNFNLIQQLTVLENLEVPMFYLGLSPAQRRKRALELAEKVGLADRADHRPMQLSGGQQQRVCIARALMNDPLILLADEPTGALDSKTGQQILALFDELVTTGRTIMVVTHDPNVGRRCHRTIHLHDGNIVKDERSLPVAVPFAEPVAH